MSVNERREFAAKSLLTLVLVLFSLNTISHDFLCHEELEGVCNPLHWSAAGPRSRPSLDDPRGPQPLPEPFRPPETRTSSPGPSRTSTTRPIKPHPKTAKFSQAL